MRKYLLLALLIFLATVGAYKLGKYTSKKVPLRPESVKEVTQIKVPKIKVMVIDSGIGFHDMLIPYVKYNGSKDYVDRINHGTSVAGIIIQGPNLNDPVCKNVEITSCNYYIPGDSGNFKRSNECLKRAIEEKVDFINYSSGGDAGTLEEYTLIESFTKNGGTVIAAAGNEGKELGKNNKYFPASYKFGFNYLGVNGKRYEMPPIKDIAIVSSYCGDVPCKYSNYHSVAVKEDGNPKYTTFSDNSFGYRSGTSFAAPALLHTILKDRCNQLNKQVSVAQGI